jgi:hypothetical protein
MSSITRNLVIEQGATSKTSLVYNHVVSLVCPALTNTTKLTCTPLTTSIPDATTLNFKLSACETLQVTTNGVSSPGSENIDIQPYVGVKAIPAKSISKIAPVDLTGEIWRGSCKRNYADTIPVFTWEFTVNPLQGLVVGTVSDETTSAISIANNDRVIFSDIPQDVQLERNFPPGVWFKAWYYDWEREFPDGTVDRAMQGRLWLVSEVTR